MANLKLEVDGSGSLEFLTLGKETNRTTDTDPSERTLVLRGRAVRNEAFLRP